jgi:hypothetical protein
LEQRARKALEIGAWNHVQFGVRWHLGNLQEFSRRTQDISRGRSLYEPVHQVTIPTAALRQREKIKP